MSETNGIARPFQPDRFTAQAREILDGVSDEDFCILLAEVTSQPNGEGHPDVRGLYEPWILRRLKAIRQRSAPAYYGLFLTRGRAVFGRSFVPADLEAAMQALPLPPEEALLEGGAAGDLDGVVWGEQVLQVYEHGLPRGLSTGWPSVDRRYRVRPGELTVVTGVSNHLKSSWVHALCVNLGLLHDWRIGLWAGEHGSALLGASLTSLYADAPFDGPHRMSQDTATSAHGWVREHVHIIQPPEETPPTVPWLLSVARVQVQRYGIRGLVLDPWNHISHPAERDQRETRYISEMLSQVLRFAKHWQVHVWIVAHPTKLRKAEKGKYAGKYPVPSPYEIDGSAAWYAKADNVLALWRDVDVAPLDIELHVQKVRFRGADTLGMVPLRLDTVSGRLLERELVGHWTDEEEAEDDIDFLR